MFPSGEFDLEWGDNVNFPVRRWEWRAGSGVRHSRVHQGGQRRVREAYSERFEQGGPSATGLASGVDQKAPKIAHSRPSALVGAERRAQLLGELACLGDTVDRDYSASVGQAWFELGSLRRDGADGIDVQPVVYAVGRQHRAGR